MPDPLYHLVPAEEWSEVVHAYEPPSLEEEGFVHCSGRDQVARVAAHLFAGRQDLLLLEIDPSRLSAEVVWEDLYGLEEDFPHIYGPIERSAVLRVLAFPPDEQDWSS